MQNDGKTIKFKVFQDYEGILSPASTCFSHNKDVKFQIPLTLFEIVDLWHVLRQQIPNDFSDYDRDIK